MLLLLVRAWVWRMAEPGGWQTKAEGDRCDEEGALQTTRAHGAGNLKADQLDIEALTRIIGRLEAELNTGPRPLRQAALEQQLEDARELCRSSRTVGVAQERKGGRSEQDVRLAHSEAAKRRLMTWVKV
jgi:hypothetical protein